ncbi:hypothetical protein [uncultured Dysgonomonas sp.]|uniref:hypothetical protein n=1 Tax=uncultured Dysgonomonas sp. TaxID=206096 RepID=UPI002805F98A|nr:hypothetical protein [uncultured Dysgonomonas sp.]
MQSFILKNNFIHLLVIILINIFYTVIINTYIQTEDIYYNFLLSNYPSEIATKVFESTLSYKFLVYILSPVIIILRTLIFAIILDAILTCKNIYQSGDLSTGYKFSQFWKIFICAEWSCVAFVAVKFFWFAFFHTDYNYNDLIDYSPLSLYSLVGNSNVDSWLVYPMKMFNLFELAYLVIAITVCRKTLKISRTDSIFYISLSYIIPLFIFIIFIMYVNLHFM